MQIESNAATVSLRLSAQSLIRATFANGRNKSDKLMETHLYSLYFSINCYFSTQHVDVRVERAE
jgi:hypothetical protein